MMAEPAPQSAFTRHRNLRWIDAESTLVSLPNKKSSTETWCFADVQWPSRLPVPVEWKIQADGEYISLTSVSFAERLAIDKCPEPP
jgi:hypothetical protein